MSSIPVFSKVFPLYGEGIEPETHQTHNNCILVRNLQLDNQTIGHFPDPDNISQEIFVLSSEVLVWIIGIQTTETLTGAPNKNDPTFNEK